MGFLQFGAIAEQVQHAVIVDLELGGSAPSRRNPSCLISFMSGAMIRTGHQSRSRVPDRASRPVNRWPRSAQYSSHLFSIMLRVQR